MKYAFNDNGVLRDVVMSHPATLFAFGYASQFIEVPDNAQTGYLWDGQTASPPPEPEPAKPTVVTMRQARLALLGAGLLSQVDAAIAAMPGTEGEAARIEWEYAATVERNSALVSGLAVALNLTEQQLDELFVAAAAL